MDEGIEKDEKSQAKKKKKFTITGSEGRQKSSPVVPETHEQPEQRQMELGQMKPSMDGGTGLTQL